MSVGSCPYKCSYFFRLHPLGSFRGFSVSHKPLIQCMCLSRTRRSIFPRLYAVRGCFCATKDLVATLPSAMSSYPLYDL